MQTDETEIDSSTVDRGIDTAEDEEVQQVPHFHWLYYDLTDMDQREVGRYLLRAGRVWGRAVMRELAHWQVLDTNPLPTEENENSWNFYALSRISDHLLLAFQDDYRVFSNILPNITVDEYADFFTALGFEPFFDRSYSPFLHEIVEVWEGGDESGPGVTVDKVFWPGLMYGQLLFSRAGVRVRCRPGILNTTIAERSVLYFAHKRLRRWTHDLSIGWGHNSQWRTLFHRNYEDAEHFYFNVDGKYDLNQQNPPSHTEDHSFPEEAAEEQLPLEARRELLVHRCFVRSELRDTGRSPFWDRVTVEKAHPKWSE